MVDTSVSTDLGFMHVVDRGMLQRYYQLFRTMSIQRHAHTQTSGQHMLEWQLFPTMLPTRPSTTPLLLTRRLGHTLSTLEATGIVLKLKFKSTKGCMSRDTWSLARGWANAEGTTIFVGVGHMKWNKTKQTDWKPHTQCMAALSTVLQKHTGIEHPRNSGTLN